MGVRKYFTKTISIFFSVKFESVWYILDHIVGVQFTKICWQLFFVGCVGVRWIGYYLQFWLGKKYSYEYADWIEKKVASSCVQRLSLKQNKDCRFPHSFLLNSLHSFDLSLLFHKYVSLICFDAFWLVSYVGAGIHLYWIWISCMNGGAFFPR